MGKSLKQMQMKLDIAKTLCKAAGDVHQQGVCVFCGNGKCEDKMVKTFYPEAQAVIDMLNAFGYLKNDKPNKLLPGLGG